jgi:hypothetical protein
MATLCIWFSPDANVQHCFTDYMSLTIALFGTLSKLIGQLL